MNQQVMLKKLMKMKEEMEATQQQIYDTEFKASAGGVVTVTIMGNREIVDVEIDKDFEATSKEDLEMLQDSIIAACNQAYDEIDDVTEEKMAKYSALTGGMGF